MLKNLCLFFVMVVSIICVYSVNRKPVFIDYSNDFTLYTQSNSSNCNFTNVNKLEYVFSINVFGEACAVEVNRFDLDDFLQKFNAKIVDREQTDETISYYAYSPQIKYLQIVKGEKVNLHVAIGKDRVVLGSPVIYGSF